MDLQENNYSNDLLDIYSIIRYALNHTFYILHVC